MSERSVEDRVMHWWPGYWRGFVEGMIFGAVLALTICEYFAGWFG